MKVIALFFLMLSFGVTAQDSHQRLDSLFQNRSLSDFERSVGMSDFHYLDSALYRTVYNAYQSFVGSVHDKIHDNKSLTDKEIIAGYEALIQKTKPAVEVAKPLPEPPEPLPVPESAACDILGFENGDFTGWELIHGQVTGAGTFSFSGATPIAPGTYHTIQTGGTDPITGIPTVDPTGGSYSVMLGDDTGIGSQAARMEHSFVVDANTTMFEYSYAVVFESPLSHSPNELPYFTIRMYDEDGISIPCGDYSVYADAGTVQDYQVIPGSPDVLYKDWTKVITNLSAYLGETVTIEFTTGDCSLSGHYGYAYIDASCGVDTLSATKDTICPGESTTITAPPGVDTYFWALGGGNGVNTQSLTVDSGGVYTCYMSPLQGASCYFTMDYTIIEKIAPEVEFEQDLDSICFNDAVIFTDQSTIDAPETITGYSWDFGDGVTTAFDTGPMVGVQGTSGTYTNPSHIYGLNGEFPVELTVTSSTGCENSYKDTVVVNELPVVVAGPDLLFCDTSDITLSGSGANSYAWDNGVTDGVVFTQNAGETITYTVTGTDVNGCQNTDQVTVETATLPEVEAGPDQIVCEGTTVSLSGSGAESYSWDNGVSDGDDFVQAVGVVNYTVVGTDTNGCQNTDQVMITVNPLPIVDAGVDQTVCEEAPVALNGNGSNTPTWTNGFLNGAPFVQPVGTATYILADTLNTGCFASDSMMITVLPNPEVTALDTAVCFGESVTLFGEGTVSYTWSDGVIDGVPFVPNQTNSYTVIGTDANGCTDSETIVVTVHPNPIANFTLVDTLMTEESPFTTFNNYSTGATSYVWDFGDGSAESTDFEPIHYFPNDYTSYYQVMLTAISDEGCIDIAHQNGLVYAEQTIYVPNSFTPDDDEFNQIFIPILNGYDELDFSMYIFNRWGEIIFETHDVNVGWDGTYGGQGYAVQDGTYTWKIEVGKKKSAEKETFVGHVTVIK